MSARGFIGFKYRGEIKGHYNHSDSYPDGIGFDLLNALYCKYSWEVIKDFFLNRVSYLEAHIIKSIERDLNKEE